MMVAIDKKCGPFVLHNEVKCDDSMPHSRKTIGIIRTKLADRNEQEHHSSSKSTSYCFFFFRILR